MCCSVAYEPSKGLSVTETYWCRACGQETTMAGRCPACGEELTLLPLPPLARVGDGDEGADGAVGFELVDWAGAERADLVAWLVASRIPHRLEGDAVYVDPADEDRTDAIIDWVTSPERPGNERVPIEQMRTALVALRRACRSIERDPGLIANPDLLDQIHDVLELGVPASWPVEAWYEVRLLTDKLVDEGADAPNPLLVHWARRVAWLIRVYGDGSGPGARLQPASAPAPSAPSTAPPTSAVTVPPASAATGAFLSWCPKCLFDGVAIGDRCPRCRQPLIKSTVAALPEADPDDATVLEIEYRLDDWDHEQRDGLIARLFDSGVSHRFEGDDSLIVAGANEALVDALVDEVVTPPAPEYAERPGAPGGMPAEPDAADALRRLLESARTVARTPSAAESPEFTHAALDVLTMNTPFGIDREQWEDAAQLTHSLLHGDTSDSAGAANRAASLVRLLTPWVSATTDLPAREDRDQDELVYELGTWPAEQRRLLTLALDREAVTYSWENDTDLIVDGGDESRIDALLDEAEGPEEPEVVEDAGTGEQDYQVISSLFGVCDRLAHRPADNGLRAEAAAAADAVGRLSVPYGVADSDWWQLRSRARELAAGLTDSAVDDNVIAEQAGTLRDLLRGFL
jgi:hypothetical protein